MKKISLFFMSLILFFTLTACGNSCKHEWTEWETTKNPTCNAYGERVHHCTVCLDEKTEKIEKLSHSFGEAYAKNENGHYHFCEICGYEEAIEAHTPGKENELGNVHCSTCEYLLVENKNSFYDTLLKVEKSYILKLEDFVITNEFYEIVDQEMEVNVANGRLNGYAIFMEKENGYNILVQGDLTYDYENSVAKLDALFDGDNLYFKCSLDSDEMEEEIYSAKITYEQCVDLIVDNYGGDAEDIIMNFEVMPNIIAKLLNVADNELIQIIVDFLFTKEETADGYTLEFNLEKLVDLINFGTSKPITNMFDKIFGDGKYEISKKNFIKLFDSKLSTLFKMLEVKYDINVKQVLLDACKAMGEDPSEIEVFFNDDEMMNKTLIEIISESDDMTREEILQELDEMFNELESFVMYDQFEANEIIDAINLINDSMSLVVTTDKKGYITRLDANVDIDFIEDVTVSGKVSITEYTNEAEFNKIADEIIKLFEETIPTFSDEEFEMIKNGKITVSDTTIALQIKEKHTVVDVYYGTYQELYYYEYTYLTFNIDEIGRVFIENSSSTYMDNTPYSYISISATGNCSGKIVVDSQLYYADGTEAYIDYSINYEKTIKDEVVTFDIYYNITEEEIKLYCDLQNDYIE